MKSTTLKSIGKVIRPRGLKGEVFVKPWDREASWVKKLKNVSIVDAKGNVFDAVIESIKWQREMLVIKFKAISNRTEAEAVKGSELKVDAELLPQLEEGEFYIEDLVNLTVTSMDSGKILGKVRDVLSSDVGDFLEVCSDSLSETVLVPFKDMFVPKIDQTTIFITGLDELFITD